MFLIPVTNTAEDFIFSLQSITNYYSHKTKIGSRFSIVLCIFLQERQNAMEKVRVKSFSASNRKSWLQKPTKPFWRGELKITKVHVLENNS